MPAALTIRMDGQDLLVSVGAGQFLLEAAELAGIALPVQCRQGICGACMAKLLIGGVTMANSQALSKRDKADGYILACQATADADTITISYDD